MTTIETIVIIIIAIISLPKICKFIRRPSLLYCSYLLVGLGLGGVLGLYTRFMLEEVGKIGFILLLFIIGLEIELPSLPVIRKNIPFSFFWLAIQIPLIAFVSYLFDYGWCFGFIAAAGINACSLSVSYGLLKNQSYLLDQENKNNILVSMIILEVISLFILAASDVLCKYGWGKEVLWQGGALIGFILMIKLFSNSIHYYLSFLLEGKNKWKIHQTLLVIFLIAIIGERLGLSAPKSAFFLGLFMRAATSGGLKFEDELKPLAMGILIPIFFLSLGTRISIGPHFYKMLPFVLLTCVFLLIIRYFIFRRTFSITLKTKYFLLFCPNITMASVAAEILIHNQFPQQQVDLLLSAGLILTVGSALFFPTTIRDDLKLSPTLTLKP